MSKNQYKYEFKEYLNKYPLGKVGRLSLEEEYAKISIISYILSRDIGVHKDKIIFIMCDLRGFTGSRIHDLYTAERKLGVRHGFIDDWDSIQYLKENNTQIMLGMEQFIRHCLRDIYRGV